MSVERKYYEQGTGYGPYGTEVLLGPYRPLRPEDKGKIDPGLIVIIGKDEEQFVPVRAFKLKGDNHGPNMDGIDVPTPTEEISVPITDSTLPKPAEMVALSDPILNNVTAIKHWGRLRPNGGTRGPGSYPLRKAHAKK